MVQGGEAVDHNSIVHTTRRRVPAGIAATLAPGPLAAQVMSRDGTHRLGVFMPQPANGPTGKVRATADEVIE